MYETVIALFCGHAWGQAARADCNGSAKPCSLPNGTSHIVLSEGAKGPVPAVLLIHGYGGEDLGTIRNKGMVKLMLGRFHV